MAEKNKKREGPRRHKAHLVTPAVPTAAGTVFTTEQRRFSEPCVRSCLARKTGFSPTLRSPNCKIRTLSREHRAEQTRRFPDLHFVPSTGRPDSALFIGVKLAALKHLPFRHRRRLRLRWQLGVYFVPITHLPCKNSMY